MDPGLSHAPRPCVRVSRSSLTADAPSPGVARATRSPAFTERHVSQAPSAYSVGNVVEVSISATADDELPSVTAPRGTAKKKAARLVISDEVE